jgi:hypothetical protein
VVGVDAVNVAERNCVRGARSPLLRGGDPAGVGIEEEEEDHAEGHEVHVDAEEDAAVVEAPAGLHAADGVDGAGDGGYGGKDEQRRSAVVGEVGELEGDAKTDEDENIPAYQGSMTRIEDGMFHVRRSINKDKCAGGFVPASGGCDCVRGSGWGKIFGVVAAATKRIAAKAPARVAVE